MSSILNRQSVLALKTESTEGTPASPSAATDFIALQPDFHIKPGISSIQNVELKSSLAPSKPIRGIEKPEAQFSHYFRPSGVVAQAPDFAKLLIACIGAETIASTEYDTHNSSTTSLLKVGTGEADTFDRGEALLIKDAVNGYRIRCLDAASDTDLTLGFAIPNAPASGINLGQACLYKPLNSAQPTLTLWHYLGNAGAVQMIPGCRVNDFSLKVSTGELLNAAYTLQGLQYYFDPINITASTRYIDWTDDSGTYAVAIGVQWYNNPNDLASEIQTQMNDSASTKTFTVTYDNTNGKFTILCTGTVLTLKWNTGTNTANSIASKIGFSTAADSSGTAATTGYTSTTAQSFVAGYTPTYDSQDPIAAKDHELMVGSTTDYACFHASNFDMHISTPKADILDLCAQSGISASVLTGRDTTIQIEALLTQFDAKPFYNMQQNQNVKFQYSFGAKQGGNWVAGQCGAVYSPTATITAIEIVDKDGLARVSLTLTCYANATGQGEVYVNFL